VIKLIKANIHDILFDNRFEEILVGSVWALSARVIATGIGMIVSIIVARAYGAEVLGILAVIESFLLIVTIFTVLGTNTSILRLIPEHLARYSPTSAFKVYRKTQYLVAGVSVAVGFIIFLCAGFIAETIFSKPHLEFYFSLAAILILFKSLMNLNTSAVRGVRLIRSFAFMHLLPSLSQFLILVPLTLFLFNRANPIYAMFASIVITAIVGVLIMNRVFTKKTKPDDTRYPVPIKEILRISFPMLMTATMGFIIAQTGVIMLGIFRSEAEVGYYAIAVKLATLTSFVLMAVGSMAAPKFAELFHSGKVDELFYVAKKSAKLIFWTSTPILLGLIVLGKPILQIAFGNEFEVAYLSLIFLGMGQFVRSISGTSGLFMVMTGNQKIYRNIVTTAAIVNIFLNFILIPEYGINGAALSALFSLIAWNIAALCYIKMKFGKTTGYFPMLM